MRFSDLFFIDASGFHTSDYPTVLQWLQGEYRDIYGQDTNLDPDTQDGQWVAIQAQAYYDAGMMAAATYNSFSPAFAQGTGLARNVKINGISRRPATNSTADVEIVGVAGTAIANGLVEDTLGRKWVLPALVTIPISGSITVTVTAQDVGKIAAQENTINKIATPTLGWQSVNNPLAATEGVAIETDAELRIRQASSVALPSLTVLEGTVGAVQNVPGVTDVRGYENDTKVIDGNGIDPNSICIVVQGGDVVDIANAIAAKKTPGGGTFGSTTQLVFDSNGMPINIKFQRPTVVEIKARVTITTRTGWSSDYIEQIKQAIVDTINQGRIGSTVLITKLYTPAYLTGTPASDTFDITLLEIAKVADSFGTSNIALDFDELADCDILDVGVIVT